MGTEKQETAVDCTGSAQEVTDAMVEAGAMVLCGPEAFDDAHNAAWARRCARKVLEAALAAAIRKKE